MEEEKRLNIKIPVSLHTHFKILAAKRETTMKDLLIKFIKDEVKKEESKK